jgi:predicted acetyltransferase
MDIKLRQLSTRDGIEIFEMIREIGPGENGFMNREYNMPYSSFGDYLKMQDAYSEGENLKPNHVPQTIYWLYVNGNPVGIAKLRHYLNEDLKKLGGHIGYCIRPTARCNGYGTIILKETLKKAKELGIEDVLITCNEDNLLSKRVILSNGGVIEDIVDGKCRYWIKNS